MKLINRKRKLLVETLAGWITVPVDFFLQQTMQVYDNNNDAQEN